MTQSTSRPWKRLIPFRREGEHRTSVRIHSYLCADTPSDDLWARAVETLPQCIKSQIDWAHEKHANVQELQQLAEQAQTRATEKAWSISRSNGQKVIVRDLLAKVVKWVNHFKAVGDVVVQYDPVHAALPWAGFRFLLNVRLLIPMLLPRSPALGRCRRSRSVRRSAGLAPYRGRDH